MKVLFAFIALTTTMLSHAQSKTLVFATYAYSTNNRLSNIQPLADYLTRESGLTIKAVSYPTGRALIQAIEHDSVDLAMMNTTGYLTIQKNLMNKC